MMFNVQYISCIIHRLEKLLFLLTYHYSEQISLHLRMYSVQWQDI